MQRCSDRALHVGGTQAIKRVAFALQPERVALPTGRCRHGVDMIIKPADRLAGFTLADQVDAVAGSQAVFDVPEVTRYRDAAMVKAKRCGQFLHQVGERMIAGPRRKRGVDRDHFRELGDRHIDIASNRCHGVGKLWIEFGQKIVPIHFDCPDAAKALVSPRSFI